MIRDEATETATITLTGTNNPNFTVDPVFASATVNIQDNENGVVFVNAIDPNAGETVPNSSTLDSRCRRPVSTTPWCSTRSPAARERDGLCDDSKCRPDSGRRGRRQIPINVIDDTLLEGAETVVITLTGTNNPNIAVDGQPATVNIADNDTATVSVTASDPAAAEPNNPGGFTVAVLTAGLHFNHRYISSRRQRFQRRAMGQSAGL